MTGHGADDQLATAERRLAEALADLERAREILGQRERELLDLLARFGRLPNSDEFSPDDDPAVSPDPDGQR